ncbi:MAG: hypothetical protein ACPIA7_02005, partial [Akkermansiaceae bacterium]
LKQRINKHYTDTRSKDISPKEFDRLKILTEALTRLMASEATTAADSLYLAGQITHAGRHKNIEDLLAISPYPDDLTSEAKPVRDFFVNNRSDLLVSKSEIDRVDYRKSNERNVFLAERKYWLGIESKTTHACLWILTLYIVLCISLTCFFLQLRSQKVR